MPLFTDRPPEEVEAEELTCPKPSAELQAEINADTLLIFEKAPDDQKLVIALTPALLRGMLATAPVFAVDFAVRSFQYLYGELPEPAVAVLTGLLSYVERSFMADPTSHSGLHGLMDAGGQAEIGEWLEQWEKDHGFANVPVEEHSAGLERIMMDLMEESMQEFASQLGGRAVAGKNDDGGLYVELVDVTDTEAADAAFGQLGFIPEEENDES